MARILIVDANPDHQRALGGLIRHRTDSSAVIVDSCVKGARIAVRDHPDVILVNVLLYVDGEFAFQRALGRSASTQDIPLLVHCSGQMEALTRRRVEASGAAAVLELPVNAEELTYYIDEAIRTGPRAGKVGEGVQEVHWPKAEAAGEEPGKQATGGKPVNPVDWGSVGSGARPLGDGPPRDDAARRDPGARPLQETPASEPSGANGQGGGFRTSSFRSVDPSEVKGSGGKRDFEETRWPKVDPEKAKRRRRRG
jgi:CheY-like chemotaxis protein